jgi:phosphoribosylcarboxyaminoimidazole (NCAIR) mutase
VLAIRVPMASVVASLGSADALMLTVGTDVRVNAATVALEEDQGSVALAIRVLVASVVASLGSADALMLTVGADVRVSVATVAAAEEEAASSLAKQLFTLNTFPQRAMALTRAHFRQAH